MAAAANDDALDPEVVNAEIIPETAGDAPLLDPGVELPEEPEALAAVLLEALGTSRASANAYLEDLQRLAAEYENFRKRTAREREDLIGRSTERLVAALLPVLDSFEAAFAHEAQTPGEESLLAGVRSTFHQLRDVLGKEGLEMIPALGEPFDPAVHEAMYGGGDGNLVVTEDLRPGYRLGDKLLRPAMVVVGSSSADPAGADEESEGGEQG